MFFQIPTSMIFVSFSDSRNYSIDESTWNSLIDNVSSPTQYFTFPRLFRLDVYRFYSKWNTNENPDILRSCSMEGPIVARVDVTLRFPRGSIYTCRKVKYVSRIDRTSRKHRTFQFRKSLLMIRTKIVHVSIIGFALNFTCVVRHSDQCSKLRCGIPTLPASKTFTTVPIRHVSRNPHWIVRHRPDTPYRRYPVAFTKIARTCEWRTPYRVSCR